MRLAIFVIALLFTTAAQAKDGKFTVGDLERHCRATTSQFDQAMCVTYIGGIVDMLVFADDWAKGQKICPPSMPRGSFVPIFIGYASQNPAAQEEPALIGVLLSIKKTFPCQ